MVHGDCVHFFFIHTLKSLIINFNFSKGLLRKLHNFLFLTPFQTDNTIGKDSRIFLKHVCPVQSICLLFYVTNQSLFLMVTVMYLSNHTNFHPTIKCLISISMFPLIFLLTNIIFLPPTRAVLKHFLLSIWHITPGQQLSHLWQFLHYADSIWLLTVAFVLFSKQPPAESEFVDRWLTLRTTEESLLSYRMSFLAHVFVCLTLNITRPNDCTYVNPVFVADTLSQTITKWCKKCWGRQISYTSIFFL